MCNVFDENPLQNLIRYFQIFFNYISTAKLVQLFIFNYSTDQSITIGLNTIFCHTKVKNKTSS